MRSGEDTSNAIEPFRIHGLSPVRVIDDALIEALKDETKAAPISEPEPIGPRALEAENAKLRELLTANTKTCAR